MSPLYCPQSPVVCPPAPCSLHFLWCDYLPTWSSPRKQVKFQSLPIAEVASVLKSINISTDNHMARTANIERLQAELAALQADSTSLEEEFLGYKCVDISMPNLADGDYMLPKIRLVTSKCNGLFQFRKSTGPVPKAAPALPQVSPMSFYQETTVPSSAQHSKGKQYAISQPTTLSSLFTSLHAQLNMYACD